jgi:hypothetical protein
MIEVDEAFAPNMPRLRYKVRADYKKWLTVIKYAAPFIGKEFQVSWMMDMIGLGNDPSMAAMRSFEPYLESAGLLAAVQSAACKTGPRGRLER